MIWILIAIVLILIWSAYSTYHLLVNIWTEIRKIIIFLEHLHEHHLHKTKL